MGLQDAVSAITNSKEIETNPDVESKTNSEHEIAESLELLVERDNPMADEAAKALELL